MTCCQLWHTSLAGGISRLTGAEHGSRDPACLVLEQLVLSCSRLGAPPLLDSLDSLETCVCEA